MTSFSARLAAVLTVTYMLMRTLAASSADQPEVPALGLNERLVTILSTNDIHGGVEASRGRDGIVSGGMAFWGGAVRAIRDGLQLKHGARAGVLLLDGGDQFQGTLLSNFDEGQLVFAVLDRLGYDAVVPGNHDYDFGPVGWLQDKVSPGAEDQDPRGALRRLVRQVKFPLVSANTFYKQPKSVVCGGRRPEFLVPYLLREVGGVRVAVIGVDHPQTPKVTTPENVSDLCFRDELSQYLETRRELEGRADVFVLLMHNGNSEKEFEATQLVEAIVAKGGPAALHAVVAGHTHFVNSLSVAGVPIVQSGSSLEMFGRVDLVWDSEMRRVIPAKTRFEGGIRLFFDRCAPGAKAFCSEVSSSLGQKGVAYEGQLVSADAEVLKIVARAREAIAPLAARNIGAAAEPGSTVHRTNESPLANMLTDGLRKISGAEIALMNTGGIRTSLRAGPITYEDFYRVLPFQNHGVTLYPMASSKLFGLLERSLRTCGNYGALMQSGLRVTFERDCARAANGVDPAARLLRVESVGGEVLFDLAGGVQPAPLRVFMVATLDFLAAGGSGYDDFLGVPLVRDLGIVRELLVADWLREPANFGSTVDGRWSEVLRAANP